MTGKQCYRACVVYPTKDCLIYATDTPLEQNCVYKMEEKSEGNEVTQLFSMPGPCIFGTERDGVMYFATSVEGDPTQNRWKYMLSYKLGKGVRDRYTHLVKCALDGSCLEFAKIKKDWLPMLLFQFGNIKFPNTDDEKIYVCPQSAVLSGTYVLEE